MAARDVRGRGFTPYAFGGYLLWRFWPDRDRLPFMDIHQSGTREIRRLYQDAFSLPAAWREADRRWRFDYVLLARVPIPGETLLDRLDADSTWALVFLDDAAALYARRDGRLAGLARDAAYHLLPAGPRRLAALSAAWGRDTALAASLTAELTRQARASRWNASAWNTLGHIAWARGDLDAARRAFERGVRVNEALLPGAHDMLARIALREGRSRDALLESAAEARVTGAGPGLDVLDGRAYRALGQDSRARAAYRRALRRDPGSQEARDSLAALEARDGR
jgi:tetratricopeptide (TPR) repeat protein